MSPPATAPPRPETRETIVRFLRAVFAGGHGLIECRALPSKARCFAALDAPEPLIQFLADHRHEETYVGIALRRTDANGTRENCGELLAVFVDIDFKQTSEPEARGRLAAFPIPPSLVVASGGGLHVYWRLSMPLDVQTDADRAGAVLRRLALALGGDASAAEPARVLRPAGTWNRKYDPPRRVTIEAYEPERRVALADFEAALPDEPAAAAPGTPFQLPDAITPGARRTTLFRCARALRWRGLTAEAITAALLIENARRCRPPLEAAHVREQVANAFARADRPDFIAASDGAHPRAEGEATPGVTVQDPAPPPAAPETWPELAPEAYHGLAGRLVELVAANSEADPVAILVHFLVAAGNMLGPGPHARVEFDPHPGRLNAVIVGKSSKGRKGTAWSTPRTVLRAADPTWAIASGLSSGEGLIYHVRDAVTRVDAETGDIETIDEGVSDKRLMVVETEWSTVLTRIGRDGNSLSAIIRDSWDHGQLRTLTKNSPLRATGAHVSLLGHITESEVSRLLTSVEMANGFGNRILWICARRAQLLPHGGRLDEAALQPLIRDLARVATQMRGVRLVQRDPEADAVWEALYSELSRERDGLVGALLARAEAQTLRLSVVYALLDASPVIRSEHLAASLALWRYAEASVLRLFGGRLGHPVADAILDSLRQAGRLTRTQIRDLFGRHGDADQIQEALGMLERGRLVRRSSRSTGGRPEMFWEPVR